MVNGDWNGWFHPGHLNTYEHAILKLLKPQAPSANKPTRPSIYGGEVSTLKIDYPERSVDS